MPVLSNIPVVGRLFRVESESQNRKELVMLIIPYVIESDQDASLITEAVKGRLEGIGSEELPKSLKRGHEQTPAIPAPPPATTPESHVPAEHEGAIAPPTSQYPADTPATASPSAPARSKTRPEPWTPAQ